MNSSSRHKARELVFHALYAFESGRDDDNYILDELLEESVLSQKHCRYSEQLYKKVCEKTEWADLRIKALAENWDIERIAAIDKIILRLAIVELEYMPDVPVKVVLNEAIELAKEYSTSKSFSFINGLLDHYLKLMSEKSK